MDVRTTIALTVAGIVVSLVLKFSEYRFAIAKEKFQHRLLAYEQISLHALRLGTATIVDPRDQEAKGIAEESWRLLHKQLYESFPLLPGKIIDQVGDILSEHTNVTRDGSSQTEKEKVMDMTSRLAKDIRSALGMKEDLPAFERFLLGVKRLPRI